MQLHPQLYGASMRIRLGCAGQIGSPMLPSLNLDTIFHPFLQEKSVIWTRAYWWLRIYMVKYQILIHIISIKINYQTLTFPHTFTCLFMFSITCILTLQNFIMQEDLFIDFMLFSLNSLLEATIFHS